MFNLHLVSDTEQGTETCSCINASLAVLVMALICKLLNVCNHDIDDTSKAKSSACVQQI